MKRNRFLLSSCNSQLTPIIQKQLLQQQKWTSLFSIELTTTKYQRQNLKFNIHYINWWNRPIMKTKTATTTTRTDKHHDTSWKLLSQQKTTPKDRPWCDSAEKNATKNGQRKSCGPHTDDPFLYFHAMLLTRVTTTKLNWVSIEIKSDFICQNPNNTFYLLNILYYFGYFQWINRKQNKTTTTRTLNKTNNFVHRNEFIIYDEIHIESNPKSER